MNIFDGIILLLFAAFPVKRLVAALRQSEGKPAPFAIAGIIFCIVLSLTAAGALMALSLFY
jgi:hypothetical protein